MNPYHMQWYLLEMKFVICEDLWFGRHLKNLTITEKAWEQICKIQGVKAGSNVWHEFCWKTIKRFFTTPVQKSYCGTGDCCWRCGRDGANHFHGTAKSFTTISLKSMNIYRMFFDLFFLWLLNPYIWVTYQWIIWTLRTGSFYTSYWLRVKKSSREDG